jgi:putative aldouronate transport system permease protein
MAMVTKATPSQKIFDVCNYVFLSLLVLMTLYPCIYVLAASLSDPNEVMKAGGFMLWPKGFQLDTYNLVFKNRMILVGYKNTIFYVVVGTSINLILTIFGAYALSRNDVPGKNAIMMIIIFTMFFRGGMIPEFLINKSLGIYDNRLAVILPYAISVYNLIIMRTFFQNIPVSLEESAKIDGANDFTILFKIMIPLAIPSIAVVGLYYGVEHWNSYMRSLIYLRNRELFPLQIILREILLQNQNEALQSATDTTFAYAENLKYATIVVATVPILCVYPFLQKFFVKGVMIGAVKG